MPRKKQSNPHICPVCGTYTEPKKTWQLVSPFPDSKGRITITIMGSFECPNCHHKWRAVVSKLKVGGESVEVETGRRKQVIGEAKREEKREGEIIEIDIEEEEGLE